MVSSTIRLYWFFKHRPFELILSNFGIPCCDRDHHSFVIFVTYKTPCGTIDHYSHPVKNVQRKGEHLPRGGKYFNHVSLLIYLIYFPPKSISLQVPFMYKELLGIFVLNTSRWFELTILVILIHYVKRIFVRQVIQHFHISNYNIICVT